MSKVDDLGLRAEWERERLIRDTQIPFKKWAYVDVTFLAADADTRILNPFPSDPPAGVRWLTVSVSPAATVYQASGTARVPFTDRILTLRATAACTARLLLFLERS